MLLKDRLKVFFVGVLIGSCLVSYILYKRSQTHREQPESSLAFDVQDAVSGIRKAYQSGPFAEPLQSRMISAESITPLSEGAQQKRVFILQGQDTQQLLRIEEIQQTYEESDYTTVLDWSVMAADQILVTLQPDYPPSQLAKDIASFGYNLIKKGLQPDSYVIRLNQHEIDSVNNAIVRMQDLDDTVLSATPNYYAVHE